MKSVRRQLRITPDEEERISELMVKKFMNLMRATGKERVAGRIERLLSLDIEDDDELVLHYGISFGKGILIDLLADVRGDGIDDDLYSVTPCEDVPQIAVLSKEAK